MRVVSGLARRHAEDSFSNPAEKSKSKDEVSLRMYYLTIYYIIVSRPPL